MSKRKILILTILVIFTFVAIGCTPTRKPAPPEPQPMRPEQTTPAPTPAPGEQTNLNVANSNLVQRTNSIADDLEKIQGVRRSHVVLSENTGYIGLDIDEDIEGKKVDEIKKEAETRAKQKDNKLKNVMVTTDVDSVERIKKVAEGIRDGKPLSSFANEIEEIGRRLKPSADM